jgi:hypothetical protein
MDDIDKREAEFLARLETEREQRLAEKIAAGEIVEVPLYIIGGSEAEVRSKVEQTKADKLTELRAAGETREITFTVMLVKTGVVRYGEAADPASVPQAPGFSRGDAVIRPSLPSPVVPRLDDDKKGLYIVQTPGDPQPPVIESYVCVQTRRCVDDEDPGEICEGYFSVDDFSRVTVTNKSGGYVGSRTMLKGEDARVVAKQLLREKSPEAEGFNRRLSYPSAGLA